LGKLAGGVAVIKIGAPTEAAQKELKQRVDDAVNATRAAMEEGIVPGGGIALFNVSMKIGEKSPEVVRILTRALESPVRAIVANSGESADRVVDELRKRKNEPWQGFNAMTNKMGDLKEAGIIDPLKVVKMAFMNAISVAANYLTIGAAVANLPEKKGPPMGGMPGGMGGEDY
jgi:chaperonin GroEL